MHYVGRLILLITGKNQICELDATGEMMFQPLRIFVISEWISGSAEDSRLQVILFFCDMRIAEHSTF